MAGTKPTLGTVDLLGDDVRKRDHVIGIIRSVYEKHGFEPLESAAAFKKEIDRANKSVEANAILVADETLDRLGIKNFAIYLSHSEVLNGILEAVGVPEALRQQTFTAIRSFSKFNIEGFVGELQEIGVSEKASTVLADLFLKTDEILNEERDINETIVSNLLNIVDIETLTELGQILRVTGRKPVFVDPALPCESPFDAGIVIEARTSGLDILGEGGCIKTVGENASVFAFAFDIENIIRLMESSNAFPATIPVSA